MKKINQYNPKEISHLGETLNYKIKELGYSIKDFAVLTSVPESTIIDIINGDIAINIDMDIAFEKATKIPSHFWMERQRLYNVKIRDKILFNL